VPKRSLPVVIGLVLLVAAVPSAAAQAAPSNPIQQENARPGTPGWIAGAFQDSRIKGYASSQSAARGGDLEMHVATPAGVDYRVEIVRIGWYGGAGGRLVA